MKTEVQELGHDELGHDEASATNHVTEPSTTDVAVLHEIGSALTVRAHGMALLRYVYHPRLPAFECPAPYFHPLRTLAGDVVTGYRPHDHRWHKGLAMTASHLSGQNFWGGHSYAPGQGYLDRPDLVGSLRHREFSSCAPGWWPSVVEHLDWLTAGGERWIDERREWTVRDVAPESGSWALDFTTELRNVRGDALMFGSPTVFGRELAGYSGFFWRGPRSFTGGEVLGDGGRSGPALMGERSAWLAFVGEHDGVDRSSTLLCRPHPANPDAPPHWFVRSEPIPALNPSLAFFDELELAAGDALRRRYQFVVADGAWDHGRIERYLEEHPW